MPGKKDKKGERAKKSGSREGGGMASMFGFGMNTGKFFSGCSSLKIRLQVSCPDHKSYT